MSQIATGHNLESKSLNVPVRSYFDIPSVGVNEIKSQNEAACIQNSVLKSAPIKKAYLTEERNSSDIHISKVGTNHVTFLRTYKVIYLGYAVLDRRYTLPMLPWVIAEIKRHGSQNVEEIFIEITEQSLKAVNCGNNKLVFEHKLQTISKFAQSSHDVSCFTYMTREVINGPCAYHVFQASDESVVLELFTAIREATKEISIQQTQTPPIIRTAAGVSLNTVINNCLQYEVLYLGRIKVSGKRAPPTFIDDAVEKFKIYEAEKAKNCQNGLSNSRKRHGSGASITSLPPSLNLFENVFGNGLDKQNHCSEKNDSCVPNSHDSVNAKNMDVFNQVCCDNYVEPFVQSPLSPMCQSDQLHKFHTFDQPLVINHDQLTIPSFKNSKNFSSQNSLMPPSSLITHTQSLDSPGCADIVRDLRYIDPSVMLRDRVRSCSGDIPRTKQTSLPTFRHRLGSGGANEFVRPRAYTSPNPTSNHQQNRTMLFIVGRSEICLIGMDKKQMLLSKTFNDIAHCSQGVKHLDHFGFISRETTLTGGDCYAGYIFRCQTERVVDDIMLTLKQAFNQAHHSYQNPMLKNPQVPKIIVCDTCPMHWFHLLCSDIEGLSDEEQHLSILQKLGTLADTDKEEIMVKFQDSDFIDVQEQNEILMMILREFCEQKQMKHTHASLSNANGKSESAFIKEKYSKLDSFRQKAKKSLSSSFETFLKLTNRDDGKDASSTVESSIITISEDEQTFQKDLDTHSYREGSYTDDHSSQRLSPVFTRPRSSTYSSPREKMVIKRSNQPYETPKKSPIINMFMKSGYRNRSPSPTLENTPKGSWRQAIFHRVQTPIHSKTHGVHSNKSDESGSSEDESKSQMKKSKEELRALWKKAIIEQILLIRMEKENKKLQVNQDAASHKRMKLNYKEITPCLKSFTARWEEVLTNQNQDTLLDTGALTEMVKSGVPRHKRGEIWEFLAEYNKNSWNNCGSFDIDLSIPYDELLKQLTSHQHSILIDIGRTFPNHPFYSQSLGSGQLSLFNLLKAYSLLDKEVGYCQGLSFVAGILLLHMPEERAFVLMKYLMFCLGLRRQYKTDMVAFQIQMYQLSRLIHDNYRDLYDHLEKFDIAPTLYAAPWFLTLFASQFPVGFVARLFDLIFLNGMDVVFKVSLMLLGNYKNDILACDSFESIMEYLKTALPSIDVLQMEIIFNQVFNLDISRQLHAYEVEYHVLLEEMIHSPSKSNAELENLQIANKNLKAQNMELMEQLQVAYSRIHNLEASEASLKSSVRRLEARVANLEDEKEALIHSLRLMKKRLERLEVARIEGGVIPEEHAPPIGVVYALAGSEKEEDERFKQLMKKFSLTKEPEKEKTSLEEEKVNDVTTVDDSPDPPHSAESAE